MAKKLTADDWNNIQKQQPSRYYIQSVDDGKVRVTFDSEIVIVEKGDEDILGRVWQNDWKKVEAKAFINGEPKIYSLGNAEWSKTRDFINACKANGIRPEDVPGSVFDVTMSGPFEQEIVYLGKADKLGKSSDELLKIDENLKRDALEAIKDLNSNSPELVKGGILKSDFLKAMLIRGKVKTTDMEKLIPELEKEEVLKITDDRVFIL